MEYAHLDATARVEVLTRILADLVELYRKSLSVNQISWAFDLIESVEVGYLNDESVDSDLANDLRSSNYQIAGSDAELSLQVRITNLLETVMPNGSWIVQ